MFIQRDVITKVSTAISGSDSNPKLLSGQRAFTASRLCVIDCNRELQLSIAANDDRSDGRVVVKVTARAGLIDSNNRKKVTKIAEK